MTTHRPDPQLLERPVRVLVVGCGGNGSAIVSGLPYLHQALIAFGHPGGLSVTLIDPDTVSETNQDDQRQCVYASLFAELTLAFQKPSCWHTGRTCSGA
jgi:molybdopterin/thiamine biosynthesis adenylyltransferase